MSNGCFQLWIQPETDSGQVTATLLTLVHPGYCPSSLFPLSSACEIPINRHCYSARRLEALQIGSDGPAPNTFAVARDLYLFSYPIQLMT